MESVNVTPLGDVTVKEPDNWCSIADLSQGWASMGDGVKEILQTRVCAAALGMVWDNKANKVKLPEYDWRRGDLFLYGAACQDKLHRQGVKLNAICVSGVKVFKWLQELFPTYNEVEEVSDFTEAAGVQATS